MRIAIEQETGRARGFCHIDFATAEAAKKVRGGRVKGGERGGVRGCACAVCDAKGGEG